MKIGRDSAPRALHVLLLAELLIQTSSRPAHSPSLCGLFRSMGHQVDKLMTSSKHLHNLTDDELLNLDADQTKLDHLPQMTYNAAYFTSLKVNLSLSQLYVHTLCFRIHVDWLRTAKQNVSLPVQSAEGSSTRLQHLTGLINASLHQIREDVPQMPSPSLPSVTTTFDVLQVSVEMSRRLQVFCHWSKRVLRHLQRQSRCQKH